MNAIGCGSNGLYVPTVGDQSRKQSECEVAYQQLYKAQDALADAVAELHMRLAPVLVNTEGDACGTPTQAAQSEVHGWLIASGERTFALTRRVRSIIETLTI